jgi:hypothetical protein
MLGIGVDKIDANSLGIARLRQAPVFKPVLFCLWNQILSFVVGIPADHVQEGKLIPLRNTNLGAKLINSSCITMNNGPNMSLNQVHNAIRHAAHLGVQQNALLAVQLADYEKLVPPMRL